MLSCFHISFLFQIKCGVLHNNQTFILNKVMDINCKTCYKLDSSLAMMLTNMEAMYANFNIP